MPGIPEHVELGGGSVSDLLADLRRAGTCMNAYAEQLLADKGFRIATQRHAVRVTSMQVSELGFSKPPRLEAILDRVHARGFELCTPEVAPRLVLQAPLLPTEQRLIVPARRIRSAADFPAAFYLVRRGDRLWLRGYVASDDHEWSLDARMLFRVSS